MTDLVGKHRSHRILVCSAPEHSFAHEYQTARGGKGVYLLGIENQKVITPKGLRPVRSQGQRLTQPVEILICLLFRPRLVLCQDVGAYRSAYVVLLFRGDILEALCNGLGALFDRVCLGITDGSRGDTNGCANIGQSLTTGEK